MPNWCNNSITVKGDTESIDKFQKFLDDNGIVTLKIGIVMKILLHFGSIRLGDLQLHYMKKWKIKDTK